MNQPIAIQSWCFRHFKQRNRFLAELHATGATATELCGVHADFADPAAAPAVVAECAAAGAAVVAIGVQGLTGDADRDRPAFAWCRAAGVRAMSVTFGPAALFEDKLANVERLAEEHDLNLGIHNHGGYDWLGNDRILKYVFSKTGPRIGLYMDTAWALAARQDVYKWVEQFGDRLHGVHLKDFTFDRAGAPTDVVIGTGNLELPRFVAALKSVAFSGPLVIEYEGDETNPTPALKECVRALRRFL